MSSDKKAVALVIGASRGIGRQVAIDLAREDYFGASCSLQIPIEFYPRLSLMSK
jgi:hypothetical protein